MSSVKDFMWRTVCMPDLHPDLKGVSYKLNHWPDFGKVEYMHELIDLCSLLSITYLSYEQLKALTQFDDDLLSHSLNTLKASGLLLLASNTDKVELTQQKTTLTDFQRKLMGFIHKAYRKAKDSQAILAREGS
ncbi:hypothetical protein [Kangiella sediminilitoris]|uniref:Uncharacterized protein n=1 Tax=Kangiella sediminilitoris TaxID=1144748 RepID=A0A1B3B8R0_9GAMM|nr:hypothetical protein [Kangiella sediminilitoris]AOE49136.1 hypothetical protein KS2013_412 [Kangiella sediminilitoris]